MELKGLAFYTTTIDLGSSRMTEQHLRHDVHFTEEIA